MIHKVEQGGMSIMDKIKKYAISLVVMMVTVIVSLLIVSTLTYIFKWQADKAMIGIIITYVLGGFVGGVSFRKSEKEKWVKKILESFMIAIFFVIVATMISVLVMQNPFVFSSRSILILLLITSSVLCGMCVKG